MRDGSRKWGVNLRDLCGIADVHLHRLQTGRHTEKHECRHAHKLTSCSASSETIWNFQFYAWIIVCLLENRQGFCGGEIVTSPANHSFSSRLNESASVWQQMQQPKWEDRHSRPCSRDPGSSGSDLRIFSPTCTLPLTAKLITVDVKSQMEWNNNDVPVNN